GGSVILLPVQSAVVPIEGINGVVDRGDEGDVVVAATDEDVADDQRLSIHLIVHGDREDLAKVLNVDVRRGQCGFVVVPARAAVVVVLREHRDSLGTRLRLAGRRDAVSAGGEQQKNEPAGQYAACHKRYAGIASMN